MPSYIVKRFSTTRDGSRLGGASQVIVTATSESEAKADGATLLQCSPAEVFVTPFERFSIGDALGS